ncbi:MAG TPA: hypothetical protein VK633_00720, partial [Verrucomicrobiae bacterium]|nr:hypothetical protein [Verrucomicrobiae bacterium]
MIELITGFAQDKSLQNCRWLALWTLWTCPLAGDKYLCQDRCPIITCENSFECLETAQPLTRKRTGGAVRRMGGRLLLMTLLAELTVAWGAELHPQVPSDPPKSNAPAATQPAVIETNPKPAALDAEREAAALKEEAVRVAGRVAAGYPEDALTYALLGSAFYNTGRTDE